MLQQACTEFFSPDVSDLKIEVNSPKDGLYTNSHDISFWWENDKAVEAWRYQLVTPNFDNPFLLLDSLMQESILYLYLEEGIYTWRLRAENEGSTSEYITRSVVVDTTAPSSVKAIYPLENEALAYGLDLLELSWQSQDQPVDGIVHAVSDSIYLYEVKDNQQLLRASYFQDLNASKSISFSRDIQAPQQPTTYQWFVKSFDQAGNTKETGPFSFVIE